MRSGRFWGLLLMVGFFGVLAMWQSSRFADLSAEAKELEARQDEWISGNRELSTRIALLSSRERIEGLATRLGLKKALPEERLRIMLSPQDGAKAGASAGKGGAHD